MPLDLTLPPPAIVEFRAPQEVRFGLSYAPSRTELDRFIVPRDWRDATLEELRVYIPSDLQDMPDWAIRSMFPLFARKVGGKVLVKTTVFLTSMSGSNQTWNVLADWNSAENIVHCIGGGGSGRGMTSNGGGGGGGGGAYAQETNITLTPDSVATYRVGTRATAGTGNGGTGSDVWFNGTDLSGSSVGAKGGEGATSASGASGGSGASSVGSTTYNGGNGANGNSGAVVRGGGGGGAGGPNGAGNNASGSNGGSGGGGSGGSGGSGDGGSGTEFASDPAAGSGGGGGGGRDTQDGYQGGNYGGGGGGAAREASGNRSGGQGAQGLIVIINNHLTGV